MTIPRDITPVSNMIVPSSPSPSAFFNAGTSPSFETSYFPAVPKKQPKPFNTGDIKILLLEDINRTACELLQKEGYQVEFHTSSLRDVELIEKIRDVHVIGIRSKTKLTASVLDHAKNLLAIGCFCIGTDQVDLEYAAKRGIAVFNSPFSNSRSVAELVIAEVIMLARRIGDKSMEMHLGTWQKASTRCREIRGKVLGIIGHGHIASQLSVLAESMGMSVLFCDAAPLVAIGKARQVKNLTELLASSDFVSLHVPETSQTHSLIGRAELRAMKKGSYLINASRGCVVNLQALCEAMRSGHLAGAALDVFPCEPPADGPHFNEDLARWVTEIRGLPNVILTPHIGGSTEEAQEAIGAEVGGALLRYINSGCTTGAANMPEVTLRSLNVAEVSHLRVIFIHQNRPGVLRQVNNILGDYNVEKQISDSRGDIAYMMADISKVDSAEVKALYTKLEVLSCEIPNFLTPFRLSSGSTH
ncbi:unnamed protein product [Tuber melanosporum]|uniref:(Perigord truffle) hypothetical protein n=1 Tax=Tuber melanosporum (strain Mel28) TaxID=656061 RepID=D5G7B2_TUBMM|nr:uncharacterized protein GSTUM_00002422001 [Tuber melanosporum]CAZ80405.1 unnamed protein product [Tuber melanosporum]